MKNRLAEGQAVASMRLAELSLRRRDFPSPLKQRSRGWRPAETAAVALAIATFHAHNENYFFPDAMA
jgi:hypothetical protein